MEQIEPHIIMPKLAKIRILVIGDSMLDRYIEGDVQRISPEAPVPIVTRKKEFFRLGGAANAALNIRKLGANVDLISVVGVDNYADKMKDLLLQEDIKPHLIVCQQAPTITKIRILSKGQQMLRIDNESMPFIDVQQELLDKAYALIPNYDVVLLSDYAKGALVKAHKIIDSCNVHNIPVIVDPKQKFAAYRGATLIKPNFKEFAEQLDISLANDYLSEKAIEDAATELLTKFGFKQILVTRGSDGMSLKSINSPMQTVSSMSQEVFDVTGAGDTVAACVAISMALKFSAKLTMKIASIAAGIAITRVGTSFATFAEINAQYILEKNKSNQALSKDEALKHVMAMKTKGAKIVMANGCFDILHYGHVRFLQQAKALGDFLVVALNSDSSIARAKGTNRPINKQAERAELLLALDAVDLVVIFDEAAPGNIVKYLSPDVLVKGSENFANIQDIPASEGVEHVIAHGGEVKLIGRTKNISSSQIISKSQQHA